MASHRRTVEIRSDPEIQERLCRRLASPEGQRLLHELAMVFAQAALERMIAESVKGPLQTDSGE